MSSLALTSGWYYIYTSYCTPDKNTMMKKFVQEFRRVARESGYKEKLLIEEFK